MVAPFIGLCAVAILIGIAAALGQSRQAVTPSAASGGRTALIINGHALAAAVTPAAGFDVVIRSIDELAFIVETGRVHITETVRGRDLAEFGWCRSPRTLAPRHP